MNTNTYFTDNNKLPAPLPKEELYELLIKAEYGDELAIKEIAEHNIRLVIYEVKAKFNEVDYNKDDLVATGIIGLIKAIRTFDIAKNIEFSTYAAKCIDNEIRMLLRRLKKHMYVDSLERPLHIDNDGKKICLEDILSYDVDLSEDYITKESYLELRELVYKLPDRERKIIMMRFGFYDNKIYTEQEISQELNISQSYVSRLTKNTLKKLKTELEATDSTKKRKKCLHKMIHTQKKL